MVQSLLGSVSTGSKRFVADHRSRAGTIAAAIWKAFQVSPAQVQLNHLRWYLVVGTREFSAPQRYRYWTTVRVLALALGHGSDWLDRLQGPWVRPSGQLGALRSGRPAKLPLQSASRAVG